MLKPSDVSLNRAVFISALNLLKGFDAFPFFGTLLGIVRENDILKHDDDVDFYVNVIHREAFEETVKAHNHRVIMNYPCFIQLQFLFDGEIAYADFYFFERKADIIIEKWNFNGRWEDPQNCLHIPAELIYPLKVCHLFGINFNIPKNSEKCCEYLYGPSWRTPLLKGIGYKVSIVNHVPKITVSEDQFTAYLTSLFDERTRADRLDQELNCVKHELANAERSLVETALTIDDLTLKVEACDRRYTNSKAQLAKIKDQLLLIERDKYFKYVFLLFSKNLKFKFLRLLSSVKAELSN
jgi:hypothetical protein